MMKPRTATVLAFVGFVVLMATWIFAGDEANTQPVQSILTGMFVVTLLLIAVAGVANIVGKHEPDNS